MTTPTRTGTSRRLIAAAVVATLAVIAAIAFLGILALRFRAIEPLALARRCRPTDFAFESGDVILFSGGGHAGGLMSKVSRALTRTPYTHVGMIFRSVTGDCYVWEMRIGALGTELRPIELVWDTYSGEICVRPIYRCGRRGGVNFETLRSIIRSMYGLRYKYDFYVSTYNRWFSPLEFPYHRGRGRRTRFCSDLIAETYVRLGVLADVPWRQSHDVVPGDFAEDGAAELPLARGWRFGTETQIIREPIFARCH